MKVVFAGTPPFAAAHLQALIDSTHEVIAVITQPDKPGRRGKRLIPSAVKVLAAAHAIPVLQPGRLRLGDLGELRPDIMVVVAYGQILKPEVLSWPPLGCINVHASLLPRWRGAAPVQRAILAGDREAGITLIQMDAGLDTGNMLARAPVALRPGETADSLFAQYAQAGPALMIETLDRIASGDVQPEVQDENLATYASKISKDEALLNWQADSLTVDRQVRAFFPEPVAFSYLGDLRVKIHAGSPDGTGAGRPGEILQVTTDGILVACGTGSYRITQVQLPLGKGAVLNGQQVMNGFSDVIHTGTSFGPPPS